MGVSKRAKANMARAAAEARDKERKRKRDGVKNTGSDSKKKKGSKKPRT